MVLFKLILNTLYKSTTVNNVSQDCEKPKLFRWRVDNSIEKIKYEMLINKIESILPVNHETYNITWNDGVDECVIQSTQDLKECLEFMQETNPVGCIRLNIHVILTCDSGLTKEDEKNNSNEPPQEEVNKANDEISDSDTSEKNEIDTEKEVHDNQVNDCTENCESQVENVEQNNTHESDETNKDKSDDDTVPTAPPIPTNPEGESQYQLPFFPAYPAVWPTFASPFIPSCDPACYPSTYSSPQNNLNPVLCHSEVPAYSQNNNIYPSLASIAPSTPVSSVTPEPTIKNDDKISQNKPKINEQMDKQKSKKKKLGKIFGNTSHSHQRHKNSSGSRHNSPAPVVKLTDEKIKNLSNRLHEMGFVENDQILTDIIKKHNGDINSIITYLDQKKIVP